MFANFKCHLEYTSSGCAHIILDEDYASGRLHRKAGQPLCGCHKWNWSLTGSSPEPTCKTCLRLLDRHSPIPPKPTYPQIEFMTRLERNPDFPFHWGNAATKKALFGYGYIEVYRSNDGNDCIRVTAAGREHLKPKSNGRPALVFATPKADIPPHTIYTIGYTGLTLPKLQAILAKHNAILIDARFSPRSRHQVWNMTNLMATFGKDYISVTAWGNKNYKGGPVEIVNYQVGKRRMIAALEVKPTIFIMCACKDFTLCHRTTIADMLRADGFTVTEYGTDKAPLPKQTPLF